ncbi:protease-like activity factor CPAF [Chlamydia sp. 17-3921]|uniref:protease-like activity factor CPAF n=1 Tax=Chlamydia sp. 17-3921 TaxID=2675798 RepID=UPI00191AF19F|nr:protease-like activity factor CPAF [Chlamydia sp. 17-3921]
MKKKLLLLFCCFYLGCQGFAKDLIKQRAYDDLNFIQHLIQVKYAPLPWKEALFGWNQEQKANQAYRQLVLEEKPTTDYCQKIIAEFVNSLNDYHAGVTFYRSESAYLPYILKLSDDRKAFVVDVQTMQNDIGVGDELIEFNGMSVQEALESVRSGRGSPTDYSSAARTLMSRSAALGDCVPSGVTMLKVRRPSGLLRTIAARWRYTPENIGDFSLVAPLMPNHTPYFPLNACKRSSNIPCALSKNHCLFDSHMLPYFWQEVRIQNERRLTSDYYLGSKKGFLPDFGSLLWEQTSGPYRANIFKARDPSGNVLRIGFLRISSYVWTELEDLEETRRDSPWDTFGDIIDILEKDSDALIIDQTNNPGGSVFYMYGLLSMLTSTPLETPKHRLILTQDEVSSALKWRDELEDVFTDDQAVAILGETMEGYRIDMHAVGAFQQFARDILSCWSSGDIALTRPIPLLGFDKIYPHTKHCYTKPIFFLINEENYSCADLAPTILKDNGRATLIGKPTAGAGGFVFQVSFPNHSGIKSISLTGSLAIRKDESLIENLGVAPHFDLGCSIKDLQTGRYSDYINSVKGIVVESLMKSQGIEVTETSPSWE